MSVRNLVLTGFMGTGKTSVGRRAAQLLQREFVDMDQVIAAREGMAVAEIFATRGESYFRARERELCAELAARENLVIATGGGTLVDAGNLAQFANATVVCLDASGDQIAHRLGGARDRPLLQDNGGRPREPHLGFIEAEAQVGRRDRIEQLLAARREAYAQIPAHIDTTGRTIEEVSSEVIKNVAGGLPLRVRTPDGSYPIWLGSGLLNRLGEILPREGLAARGALVTNPTVGKLHAARAVESLRAGGFDPVVVEIPDGEAYKTLDTLRILYDRFVDARLERRSPVWALGGGVVGDLAGFAAATFLRGVPFVQIPTTLLAMVDASIGGKVAVDHPAGKNLVGAWKFPRAVVADPDVLDTLPAEEFRSGLAELIKHAIIGDAVLFEALEGKSQPLAIHNPSEIRTPPSPPLRLDAPLIEQGMRLKIELVERDPFEANVRAHLNLGHTFGHAFEKLSDYRLRHGYAVAMGTVVAARLAVRIGWCEASTRDRIINLFERQPLPTRVPREYTPEQVLRAMGADKKIRDGKLRLILPRAIGQVDIAENVPPEEIAAAIEQAKDL